VAALILVVAWLPYLVIYYPGCVLPNSIESIDQGTGMTVLNDHHPVVFTLVVGVFFRGAAFLGWSGNAAAFGFTLVQTGLLAVTCGAMISWAARRLALSGIVGVAMLAYVAFCPVFPVYAIQMQKDTLFAIACVWLALWTGSTVLDRGKNLTSVRSLVWLALAVVGVAFFRNGGWALGLLVMVGTALAYRPTARFVAAGGIALAVAVIPLQAAAAAGVVRPFGAGEQLGVPLQQLGRIVATGASVSPGQRTFLTRVSPLDKVKAVYTPSRSDAIKFKAGVNSGFVKDNALQFAHVWVDVGLRHPGIYLDAWALETFGFWKPGVKNDYGFLDTRVQEPNNYSLAQRPADQPVLGVTRAQVTERLDYLGSGTLAWLILACFAVSVVAKGPRRSLIYLPILLPWVLGLAVTPVAFSLRYILPLAFVLPLAVVWPFRGSKEAQDAIR
jgi:hypothetical protein